MPFKIVNALFTYQITRANWMACPVKLDYSWVKNIRMHAMAIYIESCCFFWSHSEMQTVATPAQVHSTESSGHGVTIECRSICKLEMSSCTWSRDPTLRSGASRRLTGPCTGPAQTWATLLSQSGRWYMCRQIIARCVFVQIQHVG